MSGCVITDFRIEAKVAPQNQNKRRKRCEFHRKLLKAEVIDYLTVWIKWKYPYANTRSPLKSLMIWHQDLSSIYLNQ